MGIKTNQLKQLLYQGFFIFLNRQRNISEDLINSSIYHKLFSNVNEILKFSDFYIVTQI